ncbi:unnamed protein product, partial [Vitis vinifera]|uniref:Uncharacterized protein n=1 Tax=Vitis vinifera TaxID=29760 RepID=D7SZJ6_VITVI
MLFIIFTTFPSSSSLIARPYLFLLKVSKSSNLVKNNHKSFLPIASRSFYSRSLNMEDNSKGTTAIDYSTNITSKKSYLN